MKPGELRDLMETRQVAIYFGAVLLGALAGALIPGAEALEPAINPALAFMLFVTFLQVPLAALGQALRDLRFLAALLAVNFLVVPLLVAALIQFAPDDPLIRLGVLIVLLCPCIDYVVTFAHLGRADARLLLASTPALLIVQMLLLPLYLAAFLGKAAAGLVHASPFIHAFLWLIALPLALAILCQLWAARSRAGGRAAAALGLLPVPATALVLSIVIAAVLPRLGAAIPAALGVLPLYIAFAAIAPVAGWLVARAARLDAPGGRAVAFSAGTRNSLVVLPLALAVPGAMPELPAIIVTQTLVELLFELLYVRTIAKWGRRAAQSA
ncbi:Arsenical-resistance protein precursor [Sphingopyxis sp. LC81]|uniref:arsenic resistance protein n=1 Tax=Sphingopyxis sp. LC81 TaxID=1502850 RepID=UPI0005103715|nr:arsenic resistance protein [Sphingopyxis sp. LC81]KGB51949.1 Arsenical-resistance protein precursor [Sphingopyxis sp. LC81]